MDNFSIVDLYSVILDYNQLFFDEMTFQNKLEKEKSELLLMGLFNYIMAYHDSDLMIEQPNELVKSNRVKNGYYKTVDDKQVIELIADYVAIYLPEVEEDLKTYHMTYMDGVVVYQTYLNILTDMYCPGKKYSKEQFEALYQELTDQNKQYIEETPRSYYH